MAHKRGGLNVGPHHDAGRIDERHEGQVEGVAQLHETRGFVGGVRVDGATEMVRVVRHDTNGPALGADQ